MIEALTLKCNRLIAATPKEKKIIVKKVEAALEHLKVVETPQDKSEEEEAKVEEQKLDGDTDNLQKSLDQVDTKIKVEGQISNHTTPTKPSCSTPTRSILKTPTSSRKRRLEVLDTPTSTRKRRLEVSDTPTSTRKRVKNTLIRIAEGVDTQEQFKANAMIVDEVESEIKSAVEVKPEAIKEETVPEVIKDTKFTVPEPKEHLLTDVSGLEVEESRTEEGKTDELSEDPVEVNMEEQEPAKKSADDSYDEGKELEKWLEEERKMGPSSGSEEEDQERHVDLDLEWRLRAWPLPLPSLLPPSPPSSPLLWEADPRIRLRLGHCHPPRHPLHLVLIILNIGHIVHNILAVISPCISTGMACPCHLPLWP